MASRSLEGRNNEAAVNPENGVDTSEKTLLISVKRSCEFLERSARELLAGNTKVITLSALGSAIPLCVRLSSTLERKEVAIKTRIMTVLSFRETTSDQNGGTPGLRITMAKHPNFKGSRITPAFVSLLLPDQSGYPPIYDPNETKLAVSLNAGNQNFTLEGSRINAEFGKVLAVQGHSLQALGALQKTLFEYSVQQYRNAAASGINVGSVILPDVKEYYQDILLASCRPLNFSDYSSPSFAEGTVFIIILENKFPFNNAFNFGMIYVVPPNGVYYSDPADFLKSVRAASLNIMTSLCDYNGFVRREEMKGGQHRPISVCSVCLFSVDNFMHPLASKREVARSILEGLSEGYHHGPAPRLRLSSEDDAFNQEWIEMTGRSIAHSSDTRNK